MISFAPYLVFLISYFGYGFNFWCSSLFRWVPNHYKWIVWKLACYERQNPVKSNGKFLTVSNVLEELKYR